MSEDLDRLERDIRATRARLAGNLSVLTSGETFDELKTTVKAEALDAGDDLMDRAKESGLSMMRNVLDDLKDKAIQNPAAVAAIGAGIGWKLWKNPPVASALVGYGLFSLLRGSDNDPVQNAVRDARDRIEDAASAAAKTARATAHDVRDKAAEIASDVQSRASALIGNATDDMRATASSLADEAHSTAARLTDEAQAMGRDAKELGRDMLARSQRSGRALLDDVADGARSLRGDAQSQVLLSLAGVAVAAAVGVAVSRYRAAPEN
jgi:gas vesicle protein